jgi:hypothetical protein
LKPKAAVKSGLSVLGCSANLLRPGDPFQRRRPGLSARRRQGGSNEGDEPDQGHAQAGRESSVCDPRRTTTGASLRIGKIRHVAASKIGGLPAAMPAVGCW